MKPNVGSEFEVCPTERIPRIIISDLSSLYIVLKSRLGIPKARMIPSRLKRVSRVRNEKIGDIPVLIEFAKSFQARPVRLIRCPNI